jgi:hypothetical protein
MRNSVLILLLDSTSFSFREHKRESISSMKMTVGYRMAAMANMVRTNFSPSPTHLDVRLAGEMDMKVEPD